MQDTLFQTSDARVSYQTVNAGVSLSDSGCMIYSIRQQMQYSFNQEADAGHYMRQRMQESHYQTADAGLYQTADAGDAIRQKKQESFYHSDNRCCNHFIGQWMQEKKLYQTVDAEDTLSGCGCMIHSLRQRMQESHIRQPMQESLYQTAYA